MKDEKNSLVLRPNVKDILTVTHDNKVIYGDRPLTHEELVEAMTLWLVFKGELKLKDVIKGG